MILGANKKKILLTVYVPLLCLLVGLWMFFTAQTFDSLQMMRPVAIGTAGTGLDANNRVYRAYQGLTYTIHADARGGRWPYTYSLSNAPSGMTIEAGPCTNIGPTGCTAGTITWVNPQATANNITVTVRDVNGSEVTGTWSITVSTTACSNTGGFCFVDAVNGNDSNNGDSATPYLTLAGLQAARTGHQIVYFRSGTYNTAQQTVGSISCDGGTFQWREDISGPVIWIAYPGESPVINFRSDGGDPVSCVRMWGANVWIDGLQMDNVGSIGFQFVRSSRYGIVARNITGIDLLDGQDGENSGYFMWVNSSPTTPSYFDTVQNSLFQTINGDGVGTDDGCALKFYNTMSVLVETSRFTDGFGEAVVALKNEVPDYTVRANVFEATVPTGIGGNMNDNTTGFKTGGEIYHNLFLGSGTGSANGCITLVVSRITSVAETWVYRNTCLGDMNISNLVTADGPYHFNDNVILNSRAASGSCPAKYACYSVTDYTRFVDNADNVKGLNDGTVANATTGELVGASRTTYLGVAGFELGPSSNRRFSPALNLRIAQVEP